MEIEDLMPSAVELNKISMGVLIDRTREIVIIADKLIETANNGSTMYRHDDILQANTISLLRKRGYSVNSYDIPSMTIISWAQVADGP